MSNVIAKGISSTLKTAEKEAIRANIDLGTAAIADAKAFLVATDWIVNKIAETALLAPELVEDMKQQYAEDLSKRQEARDTINSLES